MLPWVEGDVRAWVGVNTLPRVVNPQARRESSSWEQGAGMQDPLEIEPIDAEGMEEIRLIANLMIAAATAPDHLSPRSIDQVLGVDNPKP